MGGLVVKYTQVFMESTTRHVEQGIQTSFQNEEVLQEHVLYNSF